MWLIFLTLLSSFYLVKHILFSHEGIQTSCQAKTSRCGLTTSTGQTPTHLTLISLSIGFSQEVQGCLSYRAQPQLLFHQQLGSLLKTPKHLLPFLHTGRETLPQTPSGNISLEEECNTNVKTKTYKPGSFISEARYTMRWGKVCWPQSPCKHDPLISILLKDGRVFSFFFFFMTLCHCFQLSQKIIDLTFWNNYTLQ